MAIQLDRVMTAFSMGLLTAMPITLMSLASCVSYTQLIKPTPLSLGTLAAASFFSAGFSNLITNWVSNLPYLITAADATFTLFITSGQQSVMHATADKSKEVQVATAFIALHLGAVLLGLVFAILGKLRVLACFSYLPYPVIAGFLAMIGAAVVKGSVSIVLPNLSSIEMQDIMTTVIASGFAIVILGLKQRGVNTSTSATFMIGGSLVLFYAWAIATKRSFSNLTADLAKEGWLLPVNEDAASSAMDIFKVDLAAVEFHDVLPGVDALALILVATLNRALTVTALESTSGKSYNADAEMSNLGFTTVLGGALGGVAMNPTSGMTLLCKEGSKGDELIGRCTAAITSVAHLALWVSGFPLTKYLPRFLLGGLLLTMGLGMVIDMAIIEARRLQWTGIVSIYAMVLVSVCHDMLYGIVLGILLSVGFLIVQFARLEVLKYHVSGIHFRSGGCYSDEQRSILREDGGCTQIIGLNGFVFEGVAISLAKYLKAVIQKLSHSDADIKTLVIDCGDCQGFNDSACFHLEKVAQMCGKRGVSLNFCNLSDGDEKLMQSWRLERNIAGSIFDVLEKTEKEMMQAVSEVHTSCEVLEELSKWLGEETATELLSLASPETVTDNKKLSEQGQCMDFIYVAVPHLSDVHIEVKTGTSHRPAVLLHTTLGAVCAAEALINKNSRGTWRARATSSVLRISVDDLKSKRKAFHRLVSVGFEQQLHQADQLSSLYTLSRGGGWRGVTFDAATQRLGSTNLADIGPRRSMTASQGFRRQVSLSSTNRRLASPLTPLTWHRDVAAVLSELFEDSADVRRQDSEADEEDHLMLNRDSVAQSYVPPPQVGRPTVHELFISTDGDSTLETVNETMTPHMSR